MALYWEWKNKCGEATVRFWDGEERTVNLYQGNAFLIFVYEYEEDGRNMYNLWSFFVDEAHAKRMLGLEKGTDNCFLDDRHGQLVKLRLDKSKHTKASKLLGLFIKAFDKLEIELYKEVEV